MKVESPSNIENAGDVSDRAELRHVDRRRYWVVGRTREQFDVWRRARGLDLQACNFVNTVEMTRGTDWNLLGNELVLLCGWREGKESEFQEEIDYQCARYCLARRVALVPVTLV